MNFFGGSNCGEVGNCGGNHGCDNNGCGFDCCSLIFLLLLLQNCGCGSSFGGCKGGINIDCCTLLLLLILSNCGCGCNNN